jgi:hypothetical protein
MAPEDSQHVVLGLANSVFLENFGGFRGECRMRANDIQDGLELKRLKRTLHPDFGCKTSQRFNI